jgi:hypothetical protein
MLLVLRSAAKTLYAAIRYFHWWLAGNWARIKGTFFVAVPPEA